MYDGLPEIMPQHFNAKGEADGFGPKKVLFILPAVGAVTLLIMFAAMWTDKYNLPENVSIESARKATGQLTVSIQIIFLILSYTSIKSGLEGSSPLGAWVIPIILALTFIPIINMFIRK